MEKLHLTSTSLLRYRLDQIMLFEEYHKQAAKDPSTKLVHKLRIINRHLGVVLNSRKLKKLVKVLGKERDLDVAIANAKTYCLGTKKLLKEKKKANKKTKRELNLFDPTILKRASTANLLMKYKSHMRHLNKELDHFETMTIADKQLHHLRIVLKQIRYGLEAIGERNIKLKHMQDSLGHIHDLEVLQKLTGKKRRIQKDKDLAIKKVKENYPAIIKLVRKSLLRI